MPDTPVTVRRGMGGVYPGWWDGWVLGGWVYRVLHPPSRPAQLTLYLRYSKINRFIRPFDWEFESYYWILDTGYWILYTGYWILESGPWNLDPGSDPGAWSNWS